MCWPLPDFMRLSSAAMIELDVYNPVVRSVTATPTFTGGPSRAPVMCMRPNSLESFERLRQVKIRQTYASTITSYPARFRYGPVCPYPVMLA
jgi:hypothetical protein